MFKAKNVSVKRSKTKLEQGLPIPNLSNFEYKEKEAIIELIKTLAYYLVNISGENFNNNIKCSIEKLFSSGYSSSIKNSELKERLIRAIRENDRNSIKTTIDNLFFQLFDLDKNLINILLKEYYNL